MAGCISCFVLPLILFLFHRFLQPLILKFWNPWSIIKDANDTEEQSGSVTCPFSCKKVDKGEESDIKQPPKPERLKSD